MPTMSLGGLPLPMPLRDGISVPIQTIGFGQRMHDGSYRSDIVARKAQITIRWKKLTATEMGLVEAAMYQAFGDGKALILPNGREYWVVPSGTAPIDKVQFYSISDTVYFDTSVVLEET